MARPREFDPEEVLHAAMVAFWRKGYDGTSMRDLVGATGLKKGSLYAAFGDKRSLYHAALDHYGERELTAAVAALRAPGSAGARIGRLLDLVIDGARGAGGRRGCFFCNASNDQAPSDATTKDILSRNIERLESALVAALRAGKEHACPTATCRRKARELLALYFGMQTVAKSGASTDMLADIKKSALAAL